ncbi:kinase-like protein, partial [Lepidopterella palustris CBS 459.81]
MSPVANGNLGEWLESVDYDGFADPKCSPLETIPRWFGCLASGLEYLHSKDIRHQDIKPENILIHEQNILFTDFGIAKLSHELTITAITDPRGTRKFWAPELDEGKRPGRRADVFSLGAIFLEMLIVYSETGRLQAFIDSRKGPFSQNLDKVEGRIKVLDKVSEPYWFRTMLFLCRKMLQKEWRKRPFADALKTCWEYARLTKTPPTSCRCIIPSAQPIPSENEEMHDMHDQASENRHQLAVKLINERKGTAELLDRALQALNINDGGDSGDLG